MFESEFIVSDCFLDFERKILAVIFGMAPFWGDVVSLVPPEGSSGVGADLEIVGEG